MFRKGFRAFAGDQNASVAPMLALVALMLSDAATLTPGALTQKSQDYFNRMFTRPEAHNV